MKKTLIFDMDNTVVESCQKVDQEMIELLNELSKHYDMAIATGGTFEHSKNQVLYHTDFPADVMSVCGAKADRYSPDGNHTNYWETKLEQFEKDIIITAFEYLNKEYNIKPMTPDQIQDRQSQITWSALGRSAPREIEDRS